ncbi:unnamed protein product [Amoebophrya sp. A120]|nr:unnamed protein product [Amoebophrya sp. A120]|eukprot:GSA120T00000833001.1
MPRHSTRWDTIALWVCNGLLSLSTPYLLYTIAHDTALFRAGTNSLEGWTQEIGEWFDSVRKSGFSFIRAAVAGGQLEDDEEDDIIDDENLEIFWYVNKTHLIFTPSPPDDVIALPYPPPPGLVRPEDVPTWKELAEKHGLRSRERRAKAAAAGAGTSGGRSKVQMKNGNKIVPAASSRSSTSQQTKRPPPLSRNKMNKKRRTSARTPALAHNTWALTNFIRSSFGMEPRFDTSESLLEQEHAADQISDAARYMVSQQNLYLLITLQFWIFSSLLDYAPWFFNHLRVRLAAWYTKNKMPADAFDTLWGRIEFTKRLVVITSGGYWLLLAWENFAVVFEQASIHAIHIIFYAMVCHLHLLCQAAGMRVEVRRPA